MSSGNVGPPTSSSSASLRVMPLIPERYIDIPSQRLYALSFGLLIQAIKLFDCFQYLISSEGSSAPHYGRKWLLVDLLFCLALSRLRIPRLNYANSIVVLQVFGFALMDGLLFGGIRLNVLGDPTRIHRAMSSPGMLSISYILSLLTFGLVTSESYGSKDIHLAGQHTVRMSPISTAQLNPYSQRFCLDSASSSVLVPILLNNSSPTLLRYTITPLGYVESSGAKIESVTLSARDLKAIENARLELLRAKSSKQEYSDDHVDEYDDEHETDDSRDPHSSLPRLQTTQSLVHIRLSKPGTIRLKDVHDPSGVDARIFYPSDVTIAPCPRAQFVDGDSLFRGDNVKCAAAGLNTLGEEKDVQLTLGIFGVPPLSLKWYKDINGRREQFVVEGIETEHISRSEPLTSSYNSPQEVRVPLTVSAEDFGVHTYVLESVTDAIGNLEHLSSSWSPAKYGDLSPELNTNISRSLRVLHRPTMAFKGCGPQKPSFLRIGSNVSLVIDAQEADSLDSPWDVKVRYQPPTDEFGKSVNKRLRPWQQTIHTQSDKRDVTVEADSPGDYTIVDIRGKYCEGDILSPETCTVVELPKPAAEIEWRRIHECSGDTGVAASLVLHGTPPFHVYYRMQRDKEPARELVKTFYNSRGEMTLQPSQSGHYIYSFSHMSDANYNKVDMKGPTIDQIVHPLASAMFAESSGRDRMTINSCSENSVEVDVNLGGTGPWNLNLQLVGPQKSEIVSFSGIDTARRRLQVAFPKDVNKEGGSFEINIISVEDSSGCKRTLSIPGVTVNVKKVKPTARFYGKEGQRRVVTLDNEEASLPLRLTGDGPWGIKYHILERAEQIHFARLESPNGHLRVKDKGLYEILEVSDSQCPGTVIAQESSYEVDWVPRPSATISPDTEAIYEPYNGTYILPAICEGTNAHVDFDLTGRPPFQIMYNIARPIDSGGTRLLNQPTFNSIQPRTRFQLHTLEPGRIYYEVKQVGDTAYPLSKHKGIVIPRSDRPLFEQEVLMRPSARFASLDRLSYCLHGSLVPQGMGSGSGVIVLQGTPPFELTISVQNLAASERFTETVSIETVKDVSRCEQRLPDPQERSIWVDVAESAAIVPSERREHFCVGEVAHFQLEGIPPWTIGYHVNGKAYSQEAKQSPFALAQRQPGEFKITSIAQQQKMCKSAVTDLTYAVHPLPTAQVGHGNRIFQDIHEGDQAEIKFTLIGEPPFTFTYQRSELNPRKGGKPGKVLETHTVSGVTTMEYSIFSALEGVWTVTFIADHYCRYPPAQPDRILDQRP
ncbi:hypothetical protein B0F90DRAFT_1807411 [Multifurca ochricompacta]|uniref:Ig-like domain-containing protein n=1 Tax=Multifurca ochricompacta TaxID=376703 RepID=A0AAD4MD03_9AGAM|nr:hypothetical protein B0F90DRAFT_1807411 [Multifurca ochricompacta]